MHIGASDLERQEAQRQTVLEDLRNYTTTVLPGNTKFDVITLCSEVMFLAVSHPLF